MFSQFCYYSNAFTDQECDKIIELGLDTGLKDGVLGDGSHGGESRVDFEMRKSKLRFINEWDPGANWIFKKFWDHALKANRDWFKLHIESLESMQFTRYEGNAEQPDHYNYHQDVFWITENPYHRKLSAVLQLSDSNDYEGGDLVFKHMYEYSPSEIQMYEMKQRGSIIFFPSFVFHAVEGVTSGLRHSLVAWFDGPKWR